MKIIDNLKVIKSGTSTRQVKPDKQDKTNGKRAPASTPTNVLDESQDAKIEIIRLRSHAFARSVKTWGRTNHWILKVYFSHQGQIEHQLTRQELES